MPITYEYGPDINQVTSKVHGILYSNEIIDYFNKLINNPGISSNFIETVDFNDAKDLILKFTDIEKLTNASELLVEKGHRVTLFCAYDNFSQSMLDMMLPLLQSVKLNIIVCKNPKEFENNKRILTENL